LRSVQTNDLRPLGAGEMLDRAITLFVRRFGAIVAVLAVVIVPLSVIEAIVEPQSANVFGDMARMMASMGDPAAARHAADQISQHDRAGAAAYVLAILAGLVRLPMWLALVRVVASAYDGATTSLGGAYRFGLGRWPAMLGVGLAFVVLGTLVAIPIFVLYIMVVLAAAGMFALHWIIAAVIVGVVGLLAVIAAAAVLGSFVFMTYELASVALATETGNPIEAITVAMRRAMARGMKRRTLIGGLVLFVVSQAGLIPIIALGALVSATTHVPVLYYGIFGVGSVVLDGIVACFAVVFATDVRVRLEGLDLAVAQRPAPATP
jgi:hypothetical protein